MRSVLTRGPAKIEAVITPLIDIAMLLVVFFALVSQIGIADFVKLNLPKPLKFFLVSFSLAVGFSRVALGKHFFADVLAAIAFSLAVSELVIF